MQPPSSRLCVRVKCSKVAEAQYTLYQVYWGVVRAAGQRAGGRAAEQMHLARAQA